MGTECLEDYITVGRQAEKAKSGAAGLSTSTGRARRGSKRSIAFRSSLARSSRRAKSVRGFVGLDGGSTSTKAVLLSEAGDVMCKAYQLSGGNPIQDTIDMFVALRQQVESQGATLEVLGVGTTGYAKDVLKDVLKADVALVETVAHTESAMKFYDRSARHRRRRRAGHQADRPERRARQGLQAEHAVLGRQRILPARHGRVAGLQGRGVRRHRLLAPILCRSSAMAARCSCSPTS